MMSPLRSDAIIYTHAKTIRGARVAVKKISFSFKHIQTPPNQKTHFLSPSIPLLQHTSVLALHIYGHGERPQQRKKNDDFALPSIQ